MASELTLSQTLRKRIHFDTLFAQAEQLIRAYANETWSDLAEHDPGITLLQALSYGVSDLAYRHTLPLVDLLTAESGEGIFSQSFAPEKMLTSSPITQDDYRRALLDLHSADVSAETLENREETRPHDFYFRNVQLMLEPRADRYRYWYDSALRELRLIGPKSTVGKLSSTGEVEERVVYGGYHLYVELNLGMTRAEAETPLLQFLRAHRNLCEEVRKIIWVEPYTDALLRADIELDDDCQSPAKVMAQILLEAQAALCPPAQHVTLDELSARGWRGEIYQGPQLKHGRIPTLPKERDYSEALKVTVSPLVNRLLAIDGIKRIQRLGFGEHVDSVQLKWSCDVPADYYLQPWQGKAFSTVSEIETLSEQVVLLKRGWRTQPSAAEILACLEALRATSIEPQSTAPLRGRWRKPGHYHKVSHYLPPCYGLQAPNPNPKQVQLRQFLLPFEQQLANGCAQLALLPTLLSFERTRANKWAQVWGSHLAFIEAEEGRNPELIDYVNSKAQDAKKEQVIIDYLLSYFGTSAISTVLLKSNETQPLLPIQRGYLAQQGELGYARASIQVNAVSALQRRIAARLGVGAELFEKAIDLSRLPFYIVEHRALLPRQAPTSKEGESAWHSVAKITANEANPRMTIEMASSVELATGDHINLLLDKDFFLGVELQNVSQDGKEIEIDLNRHEQLDAYIHKITNLGTEKLTELAEKTQLQKADDVIAVALDENKEELIITLDQQKESAFEEGQLIDLQIQNHTIFRLNIYRVNKDKGEIIFKLNENIQLQNTITSIGIIKKEEVHLHESIVWLKDKSYPIAFETVDDQQWIVSDIYPCPLEPGETIDIVSKDTRESKFTAKIQSINTKKDAFTLQARQDEIDANKDVFYFDRNKIKNRFTFTLSVIFNRKWLDGVKDPEAMMEWAKKIVAEEIPSHLSAQIQWLKQEQLDQFGLAYGKWQNGGAPGWGEPSYQLLTYLGLGELPAPIKGIGMMMIAESDNSKRKKYIDDDGMPTSAWRDDEIQKTGLFFIPKGD